MSRDHPVCIIVVGQNTKKSPGDLRRLTSVKNNQLTLVGKLNRGNIRNNNNNNNTQQNKICRLRGDKDETINHIISECNKLEQKEYK